MHGPRFIAEPGTVVVRRFQPRVATVVREKAGEQCDEGGRQNEDDAETEAAAGNRRNGKSHGALGDARPLPPVDTLEACDKAANRRQTPIPPQPPPSSLLETPLPQSGVASSLSVRPDEKKIPATDVLPADSVPRQPGVEQRRRALINANSKFNRLNLTCNTHYPSYNQPLRGPAKAECADPQAALHAVRSWHRPKS
ncbi:hypothetical protein HPB50_007795 [Hyalomma asiaticum]|uniref:Uncharacterized protein n=1 Tax=Hyalomma asiaticum TaxID=266040 RepID=A0ACB7TDR5_HYAAI|nr:hypothetical protein HPB50_007795 [Hyalomma asiaticum]